MSTTTSKTYQEDLIFAGQTLCVPIEKVENTSGVIATDVIVKLDKIPTGLAYTSSNLPRGTFDENSRIWNIGAMSPNESLTGLLCFMVTDDSAAPFQFNLTVGLSEYCDSCQPDNKFCVTIKGLTCTALAQCGLLAVAGGDATFDDDADAAVGGIGIGQFYLLSATNLYGLPELMIKKRVV